MSRHEFSLLPPYRLDLTVSALRRLATNVVDLWTTDGTYLRALPGPPRPIVVAARQEGPTSLSVTLDGDVQAERPTLVVARTMLGVDHDLAQFERAATSIPWLAPLVHRFRGLKPPRYASLWEACVNAVAFQQVSIRAASAIVRRLVLALSAPVEYRGVPLHIFPSAEIFQNADDSVLKTAGLSMQKLATLRRVAEALGRGHLDAAMLETLSSPDAARLLQQIKGIGPWTATVVLLRGLGRLDVFPLNDTSVARNLALVTRRVPRDVTRFVEALAPQQGMLYYCLLLARLERRGEVGRASLIAQ